MRLLFLIRRLNYGGAQRQLMTLANGLSCRGHVVAIAIYYQGGELEPLLDARIERFYLEKRGRWNLLGPLHYLVRVVRKFRPDILHSYLSTSNLMALCAKPFANRIPVVWGKRDLLPNYESYDLIQKLIFHLEPFFSHFADLIIFNSQAAMEFALNKGYPRNEACVIHNGIDTDLFHIDASTGRHLRIVWGISENEKLIGIVGRLHPEKDHQTFLQAASQIYQMHPFARFVCVGSGQADYERKLKTISLDLGLEGALIWAGMQTDMNAVYNALDVLVSSSFSESFPNVILEAMTCGVPCVVTDVGDSARIVGDMGIVVPPRDYQALASGMDEMLSRLDQVSGEQVRSQVTENFSVEVLVQKTEKELSELLNP